MNKAFTLLELLVVIAIIGILASVVLSSLGSAREGADDVSIKASFSNMRAQADLFYSDNGDSYIAFSEDECPTVPIVAPAVGFNVFTQTQFVRATEGLNAYCASSASTWAAAAPLTDTDTFYCVDSTGAAAERVSVSAANAGVIIDTNFECVSA